MFNHMYGSPFPTINPRVRYKTALERAGFDVNYNGNPNRLQTSSSLQGIGRKNASMGNIILEPPKRSPSRVNSLPENRIRPVQSQPVIPPSPVEVRDRSFSLSSQQHQHQQQRLRRSPPAPAPPPAPASPPAASTDVPPAPVATEFQADPVEKSYNLLTRDDTASTIDQSADTSKFSSQEIPRDTDSSRVSDPVSRPLTKEFSPYGDAQSITPASMPTPEEDEGADNFSINIEPEPELQVSLGSHSNSSGYKGDLAAQEEEEEEVDEVPPLNLRTPARRGSNKSSLSNQDLSEKPGVKRANSQVEKLIAQLDDVSLSKTAQLSSVPEQSLTPLQTNLNDRRMKNSSAYMSGYKLPSVSPIKEQSIIQEDIPSELTFPMTADTPIFYNFQKNVQTEFTPQVEDSPQLEPSKLMQVPPPRSQEREPVEPTPDLEFKYPPGTGPCRRCGIEPTGKRMYSKKDNELSGQWHRDCFRCLICNIRFNKKVPCYILNDKPYCRRHYHEENSSICQTCREFIEGECVENDRVERFHINCLLCILCRQPITSDYFIFNGHLPLCSNHDVESLPSELLDIDPSSISKRRTILVDFSSNSTYI